MPHRKDSPAFAMYKQSSIYKDQKARDAKKYRERHPEKFTKEYRDNHKGNVQAILSRSKQNRRKLKRKINQYLIELKTNGVCVDCGNSYHHAAMEWDHIVPRAISRLKPIGSCKSFQDLKRQLREVELRCANCHRIRTYKEQHHLLGKARTEKTDCALAILPIPQMDLKF